MKRMIRGIVAVWYITTAGSALAFEIDPSAYDPQPHWLRTGHPMMWSILTGSKPIVFEPEVDKNAEYIVVFGLSEAHHLR